jgi:hypothetical protein
MRMRRLVLLTTAVAALLFGVSETAAIAAPDSSGYAVTLLQQIQLQLADTHGGTQISPNEVSYDGGKAIVVFPDASGFVPRLCPLRWCTTFPLVSGVASP